MQSAYGPCVRSEPEVSESNHVSGRPLRKVVRRSHAGFVGLFHSRKAKNPLEFESLLERDFLYLVEVNPSVVGVKCQPCEIRWSRHGNIYRHIPDFELRYLTGTELIEIKPDAKAADPAVAIRTQLVSALLAEGGVPYRVIGENFIRREPHLSRAKTLLHGLGYEPSASATAAVVDLLRAEPGGLAIVEICARLEEASSFANCVYAMVMSGLITFCDDTGPFSALSHVKLTEV